MADKAVLLDAGIFIADNNIRRSIASFRVNASSLNGDVAQRDTNVLPDGGTWAYTSIPENTLTIIRVSKPVEAEFNQGSTTYKVMINSIHITSDLFDDLILTNLGSELSQVSLIQV